MRRWLQTRWPLLWLGTAVALSTAYVLAASVRAAG